METPVRPLISVIIPTRHRSELLMGRSLPSALAQEYENLEVVVVVDGPDPDTEHALTDLAARDSRLRPLFLPRNMGGSDARNAGVQAARGEWIAFLDDDDEWLPHNLEQQLQTVDQGQRQGERWPVSVSGWLTRTPESDTPNPPRLPDPGEPLGDYIMVRRSLSDRDCGFSTSTIFCRRDLLLAHPFRSGLPRQQDCDWVLRVNALPEVNFHFTQQVATIWYFGEDRKQVSNTLHWPQSLAWILEVHSQGLLTGKAMAGFINGAIADHARRNNQYRALLPLTRAMLLARPGPLEWLRFIFIWSLPTSLRELTRRLRFRQDSSVGPSINTLLQVPQPHTYLPKPGSSTERTG